MSLHTLHDCFHMCAHVSARCLQITFHSNTLREPFNMCAHVSARCLHIVWGTTSKSGRAVVRGTHAHVHLNICSRPWEVSGAWASTTCPCALAALRRPLGTGMFSCMFCSGLSEPLQPLRNTDATTSVQATRPNNRACGAQRIANARPRSTVRQCVGLLSDRGSFCQSV